MTGATGFVGSQALEPMLASGHEVHAITRRAGQARPGLHWHRADLLEPGAAAAIAGEVRASHLLHLAWYAVPGRFWSAPENERWIDASLRLLRAFGESGGRRAVMAGTCAEYEWGHDPLSERDTPLRPATLYGACKHATHIAASATAAQLGVSLAWGRLFFLYGPGESPQRLVAGVARGLLGAEQVPTTEGRQRRDFMHVRDVAAALLALLDSSVDGAVNIASGEAIAVREIVRMIADAAGGSDRVRLGALPRPAGEPEVIAGDVTRLSEEVAFRGGVTIQDGIAETVGWWRTQLTGTS